MPGGKGAPTDTLGGVVGWVVSKGAPKETVDFIKAFVSPEVQSRLTAEGFIIPVVAGADASLKNAFMRNIATDFVYEPFAQLEIARLEERFRLVALEARIDADLAVGRHAEVVSERKRSWRP